jgi:hypothetical protein
METKLDEAKRRFVDRVVNDIFDHLGSIALPSFKRAFAQLLGKRYQSALSVEAYIDPGFEGALQALEAVHAAYRSRFLADVEGLHALNLQIQSLLEEADVDLGLQWANGQFVQYDVTFLDERLIDHVLRWLQEQNYENVLKPYRQGLRSFVHAKQHPEERAHVVTAMSEAFAALAKNMMKRSDADLDANKDLFIKAFNASHGYNDLLSAYIEYAKTMRQTTQFGRAQRSLSIHEVEFFIYLTSIFVRFVASITASATFGRSEWDRLKTPIF